MSDTSKQVFVECQPSNSSNPIMMPSVQAHTFSRTKETNSSQTLAKQDDSPWLKDSRGTSAEGVSHIWENLQEEKEQSTAAGIQSKPCSTQMPVLEVFCGESIKIETEEIPTFQTDPLELVTCSYAKDNVRSTESNIDIVPIRHTIFNNNNMEKETEHMTSESDVLPFESPCLNKTTCDSSSIEKSCVGCGATIYSDNQLKSCICSACEEQRDQTNTKLKTFECKICSRTFKTKLTFSKHLKFHSRSNKFKCSVCGVKCNNKQDLQMHFMSKHNELKNLKCPFCKTDKQCKSLTSFLAHVTKVHNGIGANAGGTNDNATDVLHSLPDSKNKDKVDSLTSHVEMCSVSQDDEKKIENKHHLHKQVFNEKQMLVNHVDSRKKIDVKAKCKDGSLCSYCGKIFSTTTLLSQHVRLTHLCIKMHKCKLCDKSYSKNSVLRNHVEAVHEKKKFQCTLCGGLLSSFSSFHSHMRKHVNRNKEPTVKCPVCPKMFKHKKNVERHMRSHTGETPYKCSHCPREFTLEWNLIQHERLHTGEKRYKCEKCGKAFTHNVSRKNHMKYHKDEVEVVATATGQ